MVMAYSEDLKQRVLAYIQAGASKIEASKVFCVSRATIYIWLGQPADHQRRKPGPKAGIGRKIDRAKLAELIQEHPDLLQRDMAQIMGVSTSGIAHALNALKITHKKKSVLRPGFHPPGTQQA
jgi:transposase